MPKHTHSTLPANAELVLPERVTVALAELAGAAREGLLALAVGTGLGVLESLLDADVQRLAGPKGRHQPDRAAIRHGTQPGKVTLGGRRVRVDRPRVRTADGTRELALPTWQAFAGSELLDQLALERMLAKLSTRHYQAGLEPVGSRAEQASSGTSRSAVSRRFVAATERALAELMSADLSGLDLVALMVDGIRVAEHCGVVTLGHHYRRHQGPAGAGRGRDRERHGHPRPARRDARPRAGGHPAHPGGDRRCQGAAPRRQRRVRPPGHPTLPAPQAPQRHRPTPGCPGLDRGQAHAPRAYHHPTRWWPRPS
jgi:hypothetical protein